MIAGDADLLVGVLFLKVHEDMHESFLTRSITYHAQDALMCSSSRDIDDLLLHDQGLWA